MNWIKIAKLCSKIKDFFPEVQILTNMMAKSAANLYIVLSSFIRVKK